MRIVKLFVLATFLFTATAYSYQGTSSTLRTPVMSATGDGTKRIEKTAEAVAKKTGIMGRFNERWLYPSELRELVSEFEKYEKDRAEVLQLLLPTYKALSKDSRKEDVSSMLEAANNIGELKLVIDIKNIYLAIGEDSAKIMSAIAKIKGTTEKRQEALKTLLSLNRALKNNGLYASWTFREAVPSLVETAKNADELKLFLDFGIELASDIGKKPGKTKRDVGPTLYGISQTSGIANSATEQMDLCKTIEALNKELFWLITTDLAKLAKFNSAIAVSVTNIKELNQVKDVVMPQIIGAAAKDPRALKFVNPGHFRAAIEEQKKGGFVIAIDYEPVDKSRNGEENGSKETCSITISPSHWAAPQDVVHQLGASI